MSFPDMYTRAKVARIKQAEILREARSARMFPFRLDPGLASRQLTLAVGALILVAAVIILASVGGLQLPL